MKNIIEFDWRWFYIIIYFKNAEISIKNGEIIMRSIEYILYSVLYFILYISVV